MGKKEIIEIDQSGKIEKTSKNTVLALSNHFWDAVIIKAEAKIRDKFGKDFKANKKDRGR